MTASQLLIVNVQRGFITPATAHVPARVALLQDSFDEITVTRFYNPQKSLYRRLLGENGFALGSAETRLAFEPREDATVIDLSSYSCMSEAFLNRLRKSGGSRVHLCGVATETGVMASALQLFEAGVEPVVLAHACGSDRAAELHEAALKVLRRAIGERQVIGS